MEPSEHANPRSHKCAELPKVGVHVHFGRNLSGRPECWSLYLVREATEQDLEENHHLEEVGESIWSVYHEISFCPHCGTELVHPNDADADNPMNSESTRAYGYFSLFDQQQWSGSLR